MQVHCDEGIANHIGPEPCAGHREVVGEASAGERAGQLLSRDSCVNPGCRLGLERGRQHAGAREREHPCDPAWSKTLARTDALCTGTGSTRKIEKMDITRSVENAGINRLRGVHKISRRNGHENRWDVHLQPQVSHTDFERRWPLRSSAATGAGRYRHVERPVPCAG